MTGYLAGPVEVFVPYSIVFLADPDNVDADTPEHVRDELIASNGHCISIGVRSGELEESTIIAVSSSLQNTGLKIYFAGEVVCRSGVLSVSNAESEEIVRISGQGPRVKVGIYADHDQYPENIEIVVG